MNNYTPRLIAWEMTKRCKLSCEHCRISNNSLEPVNELNTTEGKKLLENIAKHYKPIIIMTGGDPILRADFLELARYGTSKGLKMVAASCGYGITPEFAKKMKKSGIMAVSLSLDGNDEKSHDEFRKQNGSFKEIMRAAKILKETGIPFQINTTVTKKNADSLDDILRTAKEIGASQFHPFLFVPTGKGKDISEYSLNAAEYEKVLTHIFELSCDDPDFTFKPTCAPQYNRIILQKKTDKAKNELGHGCMGGKSFAFISSTGEVKICGFLDVAAGNLPECNLDFNSIWQNSTLFQSLRDFNNYHGKCGTCCYRNVCGGCRARAHEETGDYLDDEPFCEFNGNG